MANSYCLSQAALPQSPGSSYVKFESEFLHGIFGMARHHITVGTKAKFKDNWRRQP